MSLLTHVTQGTYGSGKSSAKKTAGVVRKSVVSRALPREVHQALRAASTIPDAVAVAAVAAAADAAVAIDPSVDKDRISQFGSDTDPRLETCAVPETPDAAKCNADTVAKAKRKYYADPTTPHCLYGGNLSHFKDSLKKVGHCQPQPEFCVSRLTCKNYDGSKDGSAVVNLSCPANQIICNAYVFNTSTAYSKPLCVTPGPNATSDCAKLAHAFDPDGKEVSFMLRARSARGEPTHGILEGWNEFADEINKMCFTSPSQDVYCSECQILKSQLFKLNLKVRNPSNAQHDACGILKRFETDVNATAPTNPAVSRSGAAPGKNNFAKKPSTRS